MSLVIIHDNTPPPVGTPHVWTIHRNGQTIWTGSVITRAEITVAGPFDEIKRNGTVVYTSSGTPQTGAYYIASTNTTTTFAGYDGFLVFQTGFYWLAATLILFYIVRFIGRMLTNKNPSI